MVFTIVIVIIFAVLYFGLKDRVSSLEREVAQLRSLNGFIERSPSEGTVEQEVASNPTSSQTVDVQSQEFIPKTAASPLYNSRDVDLGNNFADWLQKDFLMKVGALFLLMGFGWFVSYAIIHNWIGEFGRIMLGFILGAGVLVLGAWRIKTQEHQGALFTVLGSTIVLITTFAAQALYHMFNPYAALGVMFLSILFVAYVSLAYNRNSLALASLILAAIAPYLTASPSQNVNEQFIYLFVIVIGTLWVVYVTGWRNLTLAALIIVGLTTSPYAVLGSEKMIALLWIFLFIAVFFVANIVSLVRQRDGITSETNLYTALGTALLLIAWVFGVAPTEFQSLLFVAWMLVFSVGAYLVFRSTNALAPFYVYGGTSIALLAAATAAELNGTVLTIAFTFEVAALVLAAISLKLDKKVVTSLSFLFTGPIILSLPSIVSSAWSTGVFHADFFNLLILTLVLMIVGLMMYEKSEAKSTDSVDDGGVLITTGVFYGLLLIWLIMHSLFIDDVGTMVSLIMYTVIGLVAYFKGKVESINALRIGGGFLLGFVAVHLLLVDVWKMDILGKVITFLAVGTLLLSTAFMGRKNSQDQTLQN